jgi:outer membrane protein assembly factor BamE (lipoprotein component of BamABCDE complex)
LGTAPEKINRDRFNKIQKGMTLKQVEEIVGSPGKLIADSSTSDETGQVYSWKNPQGSNAIIEFKNGKVAAKAQAGL